jgi:hypothetical protein
MKVPPTPHQVVWARTHVSHRCFLLYDPPAFTQEDHLLHRLGEDSRRMLLCTPSGVAARSAVPEISYASVTIEVYDTEPTPALEWADDAMECDLLLKESLELQLQSIMGHNAATVWLGRRGPWRLRAHRRPARQAAETTDVEEEWLFQLWPIIEPSAN